MISEIIGNFVKGALSAAGLFAVLLLVMQCVMVVSEIAGADVPVRKARLGEQDRSVSGSQHIPGGAHDHQFDYLMYEIAAVQDDVDDSTPTPITTTSTPIARPRPAPVDDGLEKIRETSGL